jgi:hypothetical protein
MLLVGHALLREYEHEVLHPGVVERFESRRVEGFDHVHAAHLGTQRGVERADLRAGLGLG